MVTSLLEGTEAEPEPCRQVFVATKTEKHPDKFRHLSGRVPHLRSGTEGLRRGRGKAFRWAPSHESPRHPKPPTILLLRGRNGVEVMKFKVEITMGNDAMRYKRHIIESLEKIVEKMTSLPARAIEDLPVMDANGNKVGTFGFTHHED